MSKSREVLRRGLPVIINDIDAPAITTIAVLVDQHATTGVWRARYLSTRVSMIYCGAAPGPHFCITPIADFGRRIEWLDKLEYRVQLTGLQSIATYPDGMARNWTSHPDSIATAKPIPAGMVKKHKPTIPHEINQKLAELDDFDKKVIREVSGDQPDEIHRSAAIGASVEKLERMGLVSAGSKIKLTRFGKTALTHLP